MSNPYESTSTTSSEGLASAKVSTHRTRPEISPTRTSKPAPGPRSWARSMSASRLSCAFPKRSIQSTSPARVPSSASFGRGSIPGTNVTGSITSPSASIGVPSARYAAAGAITSRPANVALGASNWCSALVSATVRTGPPSIATAGASSPLSGPTRNPFSTSIATQRREVPTPGSTIARTTPAGRYWTARDKVSAPARTSKAGTSCVTSTIVSCGAMPSITPLHTPTNSSACP